MKDKELVRILSEIIQSYECCINKLISSKIKCNNCCFGYLNSDGQFKCSIGEYKKAKNDIVERTEVFLNTNKEIELSLVDNHNTECKDCRFSYFEKDTYGECSFDGHFITPYSGCIIGENKN